MAELTLPAAGKSRTGDFMISLLTVTLDAIAIEGAFLLSYWLRFESTLFDQLGYVQDAAPPLKSYILGSLFVIVVWLLLFQSRRMYHARRSVTLSDELMNILRVVTLGMLLVMSAAFFYRQFSYSRIVFVLLWIDAAILIFLARASVLWFERRLYRKGRHLRQAIILGNNSLANDIYTHLHGHESFGFQILGYFAETKAATDLKLSQAPHLGSIAGATAFIHARGVDLAFIAVRPDSPVLFDFIGECEGINIDFMMVPDVVEVLTSQVKLIELEGIPLLRIKSVPFTLWGRVAKRAFDLTVSAALLVLLSPLFMLIMVLIALDSKGPAFFRQERVGLDGRRFTMYKFRSMRVGANLEEGLVPLPNAQHAPGLKDDPRRTRVGVWLRKLSLDEIPQLLNVLRGDMSIVGPRPEQTRYVHEFQQMVPKYLDRHRVKTGMTGWAQVNGLRGDTSIEERVKYDLYYIENWSFAFDMKILLRTIRATLDFRNVH